MDTKAADGVMPLIGVIYGIRLAESSVYRYVGLTTKTAAGRFREHSKWAKAGKKTPFYDWLRKVTVDTVEVDVLEEIRTTVDDLGAAEVRWIADLRASGMQLLNLTDGGLGPQGYVWTDEQREAASVRATGRTGTIRRGAENPYFGHQHSDEQKAKWSQQRTGSITGDKNPNFGKFGAEHPSYGRATSDETRRRLSEQKKGAMNPNFGKSPSPETLAKAAATRERRALQATAEAARAIRRIRPSSAKRALVTEAGTPQEALADLSPSLRRLFYGSEPDSL